MDKLLVSIIVPVFNVEKYLKKCIESLLNQSFESFEIILVNDGSTDNSGNICDYYTYTNKNLKVYHINNNGVSNARNFGISKAQGEYICFVDSDDWVEESFLFDFNENNIFSKDLYIQGFKRIKDDEIVGGTGISRKNFLNLEDFIVYCEQSSLLNSPCFKLFKKSIIEKNQIHFNDKFSLGEDHIFSLDFIKNIQSFEYSKARGYNYRTSTQENSLTTKLINIEFFIDYIKVTHGQRLQIANKLNLSADAVQRFKSETNKWILYLTHSLLDKRRHITLEEKGKYLKKLNFMLVGDTKIPGNSFKTKIYNSLIMIILKSKILNSYTKIEILNCIKAIVKK